ncbi:Uma2 family endonuclease [Dolichospermum circinale]|uniref:Uma2 family endonuclease n=1 Tax=Dolichospermum circinale TaxID=109265 RepID=UPI00232D742A|nr:Uma2 family endonuclease [Dolichospermum circinale]MDB9467968.1 Uma2 family endonuclease [Dolichospermum circinale CS-539/09]MDB9469595.1 Uma2 family endonuclease [Dolichospermum circinale CS-539]
MVTQPLTLSTSEVIYPDSDGQPMANNTEQFRWILVIQQNLDWLFADNPDVFVAGDLFWYPIEGKNYLVNAPDVMVVFGRPKGKRGSYLQWQENNIAPQVVFEILSPSNSQTEMERKLIFYERHGVEEYYIYNPQNNQLRGWLKTEDGLDVISEIENWVSPRLGIKFDLSGEELQIYRPDGNKFSSYLEICQLLEQAETALAAERRKTQLLAEKLKALGVNPDDLVNWMANQS